MKNKQTLEKVTDPKKTIKRIFSYLKGHKIKLVLILACIVLSISFSTITSLLITPIIDNFITPLIKTGDISYLKGLNKEIILYIGSSILSAGCLYLQYRLVVTLAQYVVRDIRNDLFKKLEVLSIEFYDKNPHGELMSRIVNDIDNISNTLNQSIDSMISAILNLIITLVVMFNISSKLTIISIISVPVLFFISINIVKLTNKHFAKQQKSLGELNGFVEEYVSGGQVIKAFNKENDINKRFDKYNLNLKKDGFKAQAYGSIIMPVMGALNTMFLALTCIVSGLLAIKGKISIGKIVTFNTFARKFSQPINEISSQITVVQAGLAGAERVFEIIDMEEEFPLAKENKNLTNVKGEVEFKNVSFGYNDKLVLKNINLKVNKGETIAIVGPTGAGKTTIINLLTRFYDVNKGEILIDGKNIKEYSLNSLRDALGIVLQDTVLFSESVKDNIKFGKLNASDKEVIEASKIANADGFINKLENKYDSMLNEDVTNISTGQRQLLNIARVVLNNPKILILDEATSNVDTRTELKINDAMTKLIKGRTSFVIAHRLSTIRNADRIVVINNGEIKEIGNHNELLDKKGMYYNMYTGMFDNK